MTRFCLSVLTVIDVFVYCAVSESHTPPVAACFIIILQVVLQNLVANTTLSV